MNLQQTLYQNLHLRFPTTCFGLKDYRAKLNEEVAELNEAFDDLTADNLPLVQQEAVDVAICAMNLLTALSADAEYEMLRKSFEDIGRK